jgi:hypothetical protein
LDDDVVDEFDSIVCSGFCDNADEEFRLETAAAAAAAAAAARFRFKLYFLYGELFLKDGFIVQTYFTGPFDNEDITGTRMN